MYVTVKLKNACLLYELSLNRNLIVLELLMLSYINTSLTVIATLITIFSSLSRVPTITHLKQTVSLWYITLQLFCDYSM